MFEKELQYFIKNQQALVKKHNGKILAIKDNEVLAVYDTPLAAYLKTSDDGNLGKIMLQPCAPGAEAFTATISTIGVLA